MGEKREAELNDSSVEDLKVVMEGLFDAWPNVESLSFWNSIWKIRPTADPTLDEWHAPFGTDEGWVVVRKDYKDGKVTFWVETW